MIESDVQKLNPGAIVEMFELDSSSLGGDVRRWHNGVNALGDDIVWDGLSYSRFPVDASGFERSSKGTMPKPKLRVGNISGVIGAFARGLDDLVGARLARRRTFVKYLDAINFPGGVNPQADPNCAFPEEVWYVDRKAAENGVFIEFELSAAFDVRGVKLPRRQCIQNTCPWKYRRWDAVAGAFDYTGTGDCGYTGVAMFTNAGVETTDPSQDACSKRLGDGCKKRFGDYAELPYGGMPGVGLIR